MAQMVKVTLVRSGINRPERQKLTLRGLGLSKLNSFTTLKDTPAIRGMIRKVVHLVKIEAME